MLLLAVEAGFLVADYVYHRYLNPPPPPQVDNSISIPLTTPASPYTMVYGRVRVRKPVLAWTSQALSFKYNDDVGGHDNYITQNETIPDNTPMYAMSMFFVLGLPFEAQGYPASGIYNKLHSVYIGEQLFTGIGGPFPGTAPYDDLTGEGGYTDFNALDTRNTYSSTINHSEAGETLWRVGGIYNAGILQFFNGRPDQALVDTSPPYTSGSFAGNQMRVSGFPERIPGYRGMMCLFLGSVPGTGAGLDARLRIGENDSDQAFILGSSSRIPPYSFEISSYPPISLCTRSRQIGDDANPIDVLYDLLTNKRWRLGYSKDLFDMASWQAAALTVYLENDGYSRAIEDGVTVRDAFNEILVQVDGVVYEDPEDNKIHITLVRDDWDPLSVTLLEESNIVDIKNAALGGNTNVMNLIQLSFNSRIDDYTTQTATGQNQANAVGQDGQVRETQLNMPGITTIENAQTHANRELDARSRPIAKFDITVLPGLYKFVPGQVVAVSFSLYLWDRVYFRIAGVTRGTGTVGAVVLNVVQEIYQVYRNVHRGPISGLGFTHSPG